MSIYVCFIPKVLLTLIYTLVKINLIQVQRFSCFTVSPYSSMEDYLPTQYCVGTKYEKIEILCLDKIFWLEANFAGKQYFVRAQSADCALTQYCAPTKYFPWTKVEWLRTPTERRFPCLSFQIFSHKTCHWPSDISRAYVEHWEYHDMFHSCNPNAQEQERENVQSRGKKKEQNLNQIELNCYDAPPGAQ